MEKFQKKNYLMVSGEITLEEVKNKFSLSDKNRNSVKAFLTHI